MVIHSSAHQYLYVHVVVWQRFQQTFIISLYLIKNIIIWDIKKIIVNSK